ncbi:MAG: NAD+ synthase [Candidatus Eisenbacteria bacterium]
MLRIALAQVNLTVGDIKGNTAKILKWIDKARRQNADLIAFPELAISGYPPEDLLLRRRFLEDCRGAVDKIAKSLKQTAVVVGFPSHAGSVHNSAAVLSGGKVVAVCNKIHLPNYGVFDEKRYFTPGRTALVLVAADARVGVSICEDIWREDVSVTQVRVGRAHVILNISSSPYHAGKGNEREELLKRRALANDAYVAYVNMVGGQDELVFDGHSLVIGPDGTTIARGKQFREDLIVADIDVAIVKQRVTLAARRGFKRIAVETADLGIEPSARKTKIAPRVGKLMPALQEIYTAIVMGTRDYVKKNGFTKVVVGLSGGIDSALVATIAVDALGKNGVVGVAMPSRYSSKGSVRDATKLARNLGIKLIKVGIEDVFKAYTRSLKRVFKKSAHDIAEENIQARIRGNILMALSNKFGWLVLTTGNKSELAVGYCTLYGDLAGGFAILKDVPKTLVYALARYRNSKGKPVIPDATISKAPSAELRPDQKDEDTLPPYDTLDPVLTMYVVEDRDIDEIGRAGYPKALVRSIAKMVDGNEYKRRQGPPGIKITPKAFGRDRRMPITNHYR